MKNFTCIFIFTFSVFFADDLFGQFQVTIGGGSERAYSMVQTTDGGYAAAGYTWSFGAGNDDFYIVKLDSSGLMQWTRTIGGTNRDACSSIIQTTDGGFAVAGETSSFGAGNYDFYIVKLDSNGNVQWTRTVGGSNDEHAQCIIQTIDGGYAVCGFTYSFGQGNEDIYIVKLDNVGTLQWTRTVGGLSWDHGSSIVQTTDGGYAVTGDTYSFGVGVTDLYIVKLDNNGNVQWTRSVGGTNGEVGFNSDIVQTTDGGYAVSGYSNSFGAGDYDLYIVKLDSNGILQWTRTVGGLNDELGESSGIVQTIDGGYAVTGGTLSFGAGNYDVYIVKLDNNGTLQWTRTVGGANQEAGYSIVQTTDGGYAVAGSTTSFGAGFFIVKLDSNGNTCGNQGTGGVSGAGGISGSGGVSGSGGIIGSGGVVGTGGTMTVICPCAATYSTINSVVCDSYTSPSGNYFTTSGIYNDTIPNASGCDSVISINLVVNSTYFIQKQVSVCDGDSVFLSGNWQKVPGVYYDTISATNNCDSIIETNLMVIPEISSSQNFSICNGDSVLINGNWQTSGRIFYDTLTAISSCDSIIIVTLNFLPNTSSDSTFSICSGDSIFAGGSWQNTDGIYYDTLTAANGCDSIVTTILNTDSFLIAKITNSDSIICSGENIYLSASGGANYLWSTGDTSTAITVYPTSSIFYYLTVFNKNCIGKDSVLITVLPLSDSANASPETSTIFLGEDIMLTATSSVTASVSWSPPDFLSCTDCNTPVANPDKTITYYLTVTSSNGCSITDSVMIIVEKRENIFFIPTMFSPNGDGNNDIFRVRGNNITEGYIAVYNRWGEKIYELKFTGNDLNDLTKWWNGTHNGKLLNTSVFVYFANVTFTDGKIEEKKGNVTLVR